MTLVLLYLRDSTYGKKQVFGKTIIDRKFVDPDFQRAMLIEL